MNNNLYKCPICGGPTNYSSINYQPQPCLHCYATLKPADQQHGNDQHAPPYGTLFDAGKPNETTTPAPTPWSAKSEAYWYEQYQLMREKFWKQIGENSKLADRIRELEDQLKAKQGENHELYAMLGHIVDWSPELPYYMKDEYKVLFKNALAAARELLSKCILTRSKTRTEELVNAALVEAQGIAGDEPNNNRIRIVCKFLQKALNMKQPKQCVIAS